MRNGCRTCQPPADRPARHGPDVPGRQVERPCRKDGKVAWVSSQALPGRLEQGLGRGPGQSIPELLDGRTIGLDIYPDRAGPRPRDGDQPCGVRDAHVCCAADRRRAAVPITAAPGAHPDDARGTGLRSEDLLTQQPEHRPVRTGSDGRGARSGARGRLRVATAPHRFAPRAGWSPFRDLHRRTSRRLGAMPSKLPPPRTAVKARTQRPLSVGPRGCVRRLTDPSPGQA